MILVCEFFSLDTMSEGNDVRFGETIKSRMADLMLRKGSMPMI